MLFRSQVARVGGRIVTWPLLGVAGLQASIPRANGLLRPGGRAGTSVMVELFDDPDSLERTVVLVGCDPSMNVLADHVRRRHPGMEMVCLPSNSHAALESVARGEAHVAGLHLLDPRTGQYNRPFAEQRLGQDVYLVTFAIWEQGLMLQAGNPRGIRGVEDQIGRAHV